MRFLWQPAPGGAISREFVQPQVWRIAALLFWNSGFFLNDVSCNKQQRGVSLAIVSTASSCRTTEGLGRRSSAGRVPSHTLDSLGLDGPGSLNSSVLDSKQSNPEYNSKQKSDLSQVAFVHEEPDKTSFTRAVTSSENPALITCPLEESWGTC